MSRQLTLPRIAVVGSINMDLVIRCARLPRPGETLIADDAREVPGGKGANQAVAAARLGAEVAMIGRVGSDAFSDRLLENLATEGIDTTHVARTSNCASGLAIVTVEHGGENSITVVPGANGQVTIADVTAATDMIRNADILLLQLEIPIETVLEAIRVAHLAETRVILDPAPAPARVPDGLLDVDVICPNESEAAAILGVQTVAKNEAQSAAAALTQRGARNAIVTLGSEGAALCDRGGHCELVPTPAVHAVDSTAAGDAFAGALGVRLAQNASLFEAVRFACMAGAIAASRLGAQPSMPSRQEIAQFSPGETDA